MADDAKDVQAPVTDASADAADPVMDVLMEGTQDPTKAEPSTAKEADKTAEKPADKPEVAEDVVAAPAVPDVPKKETEGKEDEADDTAAVPVAETKEQPQGKAEERKQQLNTEIRDLVSKRNALRDEVTRKNAEVYQPATEAELVDQGMTATDAKIEALNQKLEMRDYNEKVAEAQLIIESESQRVLSDFPMFNPESADYQKEVAEQAAELLQDSLELDPNTGEVTGSKVSPYKLYKTLAASHNVSATAGQIKGQEATEKMLSRADDTGGAAPKPEAKDPILEILLDKDGY